MNVLFFPPKFTPDDEMKRDLEHKQEKLSLAHAELAHNTKNFSPGEKYLTKQRYHNGFRGYWRVYNGGKHRIMNPTG